MASLTILEEDMPGAKIPDFTVFQDCLQRRIGNASE
jgi:hypothetical protein